MNSVPRSPGIYKITCTANGKIYIGSSNNPARRWIEHKSNLRTNKHHNSYLQRAWNKYGESSFCFEVLELVEACSLPDRENFWLKSSKSYLPEIGYNIGMVYAAAMTGRKHSSETREKLRLMKLGHTVSSETREKLRLARTGKKLSSNHKAKISASSGNVLYWIVTSPEGEEIKIRGLRQFCREHGLNHNAMSSVANGLHHTHKGWKCRKAEN